MDDEFRAAYELFIDSYEREINIDTSEFKQKTYYGDKRGPRKCRFCRKSSSEVSFKDDAHLIPKFLGSKFLLSVFECDDCNKQFKLYENDFAYSIGVYRSLANIKGKSRSPTYSREDKGLRIFEANDGVIQLHSKEITEKLLKGETRIAIDAKKIKYTPSNVYKALLKIALSLLHDKDLESFKDAFDFLKKDKSNLQNRIKSSMTIMKIFIPGPIIFQNPIAQLYKRKNGKNGVVERILVLCIKNIIYQLAVPLNANDYHHTSITLDMPLVPIIPPDEYKKKYGDIQLVNIDLSSNTPIMLEDDRVEIAIENLRKYQI